MKKTQLLVRIDPPQKAKLETMAKTAGISMSALIRLLIDGAIIREMPPLEYNKLISELRRIGVNLNQIAVVANSTGNIDKSVYMREAAGLQQTVLAIRHAVELR